MMMKPPLSIRIPDFVAYHAALAQQQLRRLGVDPEVDLDELAAERDRLRRLLREAE